jgi:hypothetical protein
MVRVFVPPLAGMDGVGGWPEIILIFSPFDDENCIWFATSKVFVTGKELEEYTAKRVEFAKKLAAAPPIAQVVQDIWSGKLIYDEVRHPALARVQDIAVQAGQGRIADRDNEYLGRSDAGIIVWRRILARELLAYEQGKPMKRWKTPPDDVVPVMGA